MSAGRKKGVDVRGVRGGRRLKGGERGDRGSRTKRGGGWGRSQGVGARTWAQKEKELRVKSTGCGEYKG